MARIRRIYPDADRNPYPNPRGNRDRNRATRSANPYANVRHDAPSHRDGSARREPGRCGHHRLSANILSIHNGGGRRPAAVPRHPRPRGRRPKRRGQQRGGATHLRIRRMAVRRTRRRAARADANCNAHRNPDADRHAAEHRLGNAHAHANRHPRPWLGTDADRYAIVHGDKSV